MNIKAMKVLITGADGFIGQNLCIHFAEGQFDGVVRFTRENSVAELPAMLRDVEFVYHLAGINRSQNPDDFTTGNAGLTQALCDAIADSGRKIPVLFASSTQAALDNPYGNSKRAAEDLLLNLSLEQGIPVHLFRLPNVFGKWARPNYNSVVATFCHSIARDLPIQVNDPAAPINLVYIDDLVVSFVAVLEGRLVGTPYVNLAPIYSITVGDLADQIHAFRESRQTLVTEPVGTGLVRALYATYISYLPPEQFSYDVPKHVDPRGVFVEMLKTKDSGQFSFFTAHPGVTRGGHYHHSKSEKFLVVRGKACFRFRHIITGEFHELLTSGEHPQIVETVPGWAHDITNVGDEEMVAMLWANEIFDQALPDTVACPVGTVP